MESKTEASIIHSMLKWASGIAATVLAAVLILMIQPWGNRLNAPSPTCDDQQGLQIVNDVVLTSTTALSEPDTGRVYSAELAMDGNTHTSWVEGQPIGDAADGYGVGEAITLQMSEPINLQLVCVVNGYAKSASLLMSNSAVRQFRTETDRGDTYSTLKQPSEETRTHYQTLNVMTGKTDSVVLTIERAFPGPEDAAHDTAISEIEIYAK